MLAAKNTYIQSAYQQLQIISQDEKKKLEYEAREKAIAAIEHFRNHFSAASTKAATEELSATEPTEMTVEEAEADAEEFWKVISRKYAPITWDDIEEVEPDEFDLQMLKAIEEDPECHEFTKESDIDWN